MSRIHGKDLSTVSVDTAAGALTALLADTVAVDFSHAADTHDSTTMGDDAHEFTPGLLGGNTFTHEVMYDNAASPASWALYSARVGVLGTFTISDGVRTISMETIVTNLSVPFRVNDIVKFVATHLISGQVTYS